MELDFLHFEMVPFGHDDPFALATTELSYRLWYRVRLWAEAELGYEFLHPGAEGSEGTPAVAPKLRQYNPRSGLQYSQPVSRVSWGDAVIWSNALSEYYNRFGQSPSQNMGQGVNSLQVVYRNLDGGVLRSALQANAGEYLRSARANGFRLPSEREWELAGRARRSQMASKTPIYLRGLRIFRIENTTVFRDMRETATCEAGLRPAGKLRRSASTI